MKFFACKICGLLATSPVNGIEDNRCFSCDAIDSFALSEKELNLEILKTETRKDRQGREEFCIWFCIHRISQNRYVFRSSCGISIAVTKGSIFWKYIYQEGRCPCPNCAIKMTVGELSE